MAGAGSVAANGHGGRVADDAAARMACEPHAALGDGECPRTEDRDGGGKIVPGPDRGMEARRVESHQVDDGVGAGRRERPPDPHGGRGGQRRRDPDHPGTCLERHVRPLVIVGVARSV